ncbi:hypothetical protein GQX51_05905 [Staphylococcus aureus]|nr:hypothetical protein [Staphylococcus aureus]
MNLNIDWSKDFQEFQEILNSGIHPEWLYCAKANLVLEPAYTCLFYTSDAATDKHCVSLGVRRSMNKKT